MKKLKVVTVVGTRPEIIRLSRVIQSLEKHCEHILVHTGQNYDYELNEIFFDDLDISKPDYFLNAAGSSGSETIGNVIIGVEGILIKELPDAVLVLGDTNSCMAVIPAKRLKIPTFHMEAGNRCFDERVPEELNRKVIDHLSDINLVLSDHARRYLISEGIRPENIIKTGSHMYEVLSYYMPKISNSDALKRMGLTSEKFFIVSAHREENIDSKENMSNMISTLNAIADQFDIPIIISTHPRTKKRLDGMEVGKLSHHIKFLKPFGFCDYIKLQMEALCVISDSGTISEEASILNLPAITIRDAHERPEGMDEGAFIMSGLQKERVLNALNVVISQHDRTNRVMHPVEDYQAGEVSKKILRIVLSYVDHVNRKTWFKF